MVGERIIGNAGKTVWRQVLSRTLTKAVNHTAERLVNGATKLLCAPRLSVGHPGKPENAGSRPAVYSMCVSSNGRALKRRKCGSNP